jgi:hypothetical protein
MKKLFTLLAFLVITTINAQAPQGFNYQATVRNSSGALVINQNVNFKFNIMLNSQTSLPVFSETHLAPTDDLGQVNLTVGSGTATTGTFAGINWASGSYFLGIELNTGAGYVAMGNTQLLSVPYALYANSAGNSQSQGKTSIYLTGNITNAQAAAKIASELGPNTENIYILNTTQLTTVDLSLIQTASRISIKNNASLININLSGLTTIIDDFDINYNQNLTTVNINGLKSIFSGKFSIGFNVSLANLSFPMLEYCEDIELTNNAINSSSVNSLLNKFLTVLPLEGKVITLSGQNPPAPPTGQGIIDKQTLIDAGNFVQTDLENIAVFMTTLIATFTGGGGQVITCTSRDLDGDGPNAPVVIVSGSFSPNTTYSGSISLLNETVNPAEDVTFELIQNGIDYQMFYQLSQNLGTFVYADSDVNGKPVGMSFTFTTGSGNVNSGSSTFTLRNFPNKSASGVSSGDITNAGGSTVAEFSFPIFIN